MKELPPWVPFIFPAHLLALSMAAGCYPVSEEAKTGHSTAAIRLLWMFCIKIFILSGKTIPLNRDGFFLSTQNVFSEISRLVAGCWLLVAGCWLLDPKSKIGNRQLCLNK